MPAEPAVSYYLPRCAWGTPPRQETTSCRRELASWHRDMSTAAGSDACVRQDSSLRGPGGKWPRESCVFCREHPARCVLGSAGCANPAYHPRASDGRDGSKECCSPSPKPVRRGKLGDASIYKQSYPRVAVAETQKVTVAYSATGYEPNSRSFLKNCKEIRSEVTIRNMILIWPV